MGGQCWRPLPGAHSEASILVAVAGGPLSCTGPWGPTVCVQGPHCALGATEAGPSLWLLEPGLALHTLRSRLRGLIEPGSLCPTSGRRPDIPLGRSPDPRSELQPWSSGLRLGDRAPGRPETLCAHTGEFTGKRCPGPRADTCPGTTLPMPLPPRPDLASACYCAMPGQVPSSPSLGLEPLGALCHVESQRQPGPRACGVTTVLLRTWGRPPS